MRQEATGKHEWRTRRVQSSGRPCGAPCGLDAGRSVCERAPQAKRTAIEKPFQTPNHNLIPPKNGPTIGVHFNSRDGLEPCGDALLGKFMLGEPVHAVRWWESSRSLPASCKWCSRQSSDVILAKWRPLLLPGGWTKQWNCGAVWHRSSRRPGIFFPKARQPCRFWFY